MHNTVFIISQEEYSPEDPANPCVNYPTEEYESYADCDDQFVKQTLPPDLRPFWAVDNISEATNSYDLETSLYENLPFGNLYHSFKNVYRSFSDDLVAGFLGRLSNNCFFIKKFTPCIETIYSSPSFNV